MSQYQFQLAGREMCLLAETTSLYLLSRPSQKKKKEVLMIFRPLSLIHPAAVLAAVCPQRQPIKMWHYCIFLCQLRLSLFIFQSIFFLLHEHWLKLTFLPVTLDCPDSSLPPRLSVFWWVTLLIFAVIFNPPDRHGRNFFIFAQIPRKTRKQFGLKWFSSSTPQTSWQRFYTESSSMRRKKGGSS